MKTENGKLKIGKILFALLTCLFLCAGVVSCADEDGLHDQNALLVTFEFKGFGEKISGNYAIPGNFDNWDNATSDIALSKGEGTSSAISVTETNIQFSLVPVGEWTRPWYEKGVLEGNGNDAGKMWNFYIDGLDLGAGEIKLVVDASSGTATVDVK